MKKLFLVVIAAFLLCVTVCSCRQKNSIIGTWVGTAEGIKTVMVLSEDGTYETYIDSSKVKGTKGTYVVTEDTITITSSRGSFTHKYKLTSENTLILTITNSDGTHSDWIYTRSE